jgi:chromosome segregation ATPase
VARPTMTDDEMRAVAESLHQVGLLSQRNLKVVARCDSKRAGDVCEEIANSPSLQSPAAATAVRSALMRAGMSGSTALPPRLADVLQTLQHSLAIEVASLQRSADERARAHEQTLVEQNDVALENAKTELEAVREQVSELEAVVQSAEARCAALSSEVHRLETALAESDAERRRHNQECAAERRTLTDELRAVRASADAARDDLMAGKVALEREQALHAGTSRSLTDAQRQCNDALAKVEELSAARARAEQDLGHVRTEVEILRARLDAAISLRSPHSRKSRKRADAQAANTAGKADLVDTPVAG